MNTFSMKTNGFIKDKYDTWKDLICLRNICIYDVENACSKVGIIFTR